MDARQEAVFRGVMLLLAHGKRAEAISSEDITTAIRVAHTALEEVEETVKPFGHVEPAKQL